jgi:AmmeMemoRadiSam system protein B/AmmeMemoRadiSam system protein A
MPAHPNLPQVNKNVQVISMLWGQKAKADDGRIRLAQYAGSWYEADAKKLHLQLNAYFDQANPLVDGLAIARLQVESKQPEQPILALVAPHAGYIFSGQAAAYAYKSARKQAVNRVFLLGPSHHVGFAGAALPEASVFQTPLGDLPVDQEIVNQLRQYPLFASLPHVHQVEHSLELQLPFIKEAFADCSLVPIVVGTLQDEHEVKMLAEILKRYIGQNDLVIVSSDFTHFGSRYDYLPFVENVRENIQLLDGQAFSHISQLDLPGFQQFHRQTKDTICGFYPLSVLLAILPAGSQASLLTYYTSADVSESIGQNDRENSVSYLAIAFSGKGWLGDSAKESNLILSQQDKASLLKLSRATLASYVKEKKVPTLAELGVALTPSLNEPRGAFVTLYKHMGNKQVEVKDASLSSRINKQLRGCIGYIWPFQPLFKAVIENTISASLRDPRFAPVKAEELDYIFIDINVLTAPKRVASASEIVLGRDGIVLYKRDHQSVFLPSVPVEFGWDLEKTLNELSLKAGLSRDDWRKDTQFDVFQSESFAEM